MGSAIAELTRAFQFAWAAAQERTSNPPPSAVVDGWDLLVGMLLADPGKSEAEQTLRHFSLVVGQALPVDYPRLTAEILNRRLALLPANGNPPVTPDVQNTVQTALQFSGGTGPDEGIQPRALWVFLLQNGPASTPMRDLLTRRGVNVSEFEAQLQSWLSSPDPRPYADVLQAFPALPVDVVNYKADLANPSHSGAQPAGRDDFVGISTEVDAFAYLLASRSLEPPLAVGLFGDWGSGKSFFLDAIRRRISAPRSPSARGRSVSCRSGSESFRSSSTPGTT